ncbi:MAG TPA: sigma-70 family RNA polymerase sigma factor [Vicinamibacterales bacterium]|nr:sigma-70 family RNA polymerase sigma factor [Vicinamibacterales bacterium]
MDTINEATLLERLRTGEDAAFELLIRTYGGRLLTVARGILRNDEDARDIVQGAYVSAFRALPTFKGTCQLSTWLHRIVVNGALMKLRTRRRKPEESIEAMLPTFLEDGHHTESFSDWAAQADRLLEDKRSRQAVRDAIATLPEGHRTVLMLRDIEEMSTEEAALQLGITPNAVKIRLHRARQALSTILRRSMEGNTVAAPGIQRTTCRTHPVVPTPSPSTSRYSPA